MHRQIYAEVPPRVEYSLTPLGESLRPIVMALKRWGDNYLAQPAQRKRAA